MTNIPTDESVDAASDRVRPLRVLTVCTHNRTRSVMSAAMIEALLADRLGAGVAAVQSSGFGPRDQPAIPDAVDAMRRRGLDVSLHRSAATTASLVDGADVILTAERDHVVKIAALSPASFRRAMTLPEFLALAAGSPPSFSAPSPSGPDADRVRTWVEQLTEQRRAGAYLQAAVPEVADPTGSPLRVFEAAAADIERQCREAVAYLAAATGNGTRGA